MNVDRLLEALERHMSEVLEPQRLAETQLGDRVGHEDFLGGGVRAETRGELDRRAEQIVVAFDRLSGSHSDPYSDCLRRIVVTMLGQALLHIDAATNR